MTPNPLPWAVSLIAGTALVLGTSSTSGLGLALLALILTTWAADNQSVRNVIWSGALFAIAVWAAITLCLPDANTGVIVWHRPSWTPTPGLSLGGPLTAAGLLAGVRGALRAAACLLIIAVGWQQVPPRAWQRLARATVGQHAPAVAPLCHLGAAISMMPTATGGWLGSWLTTARTMAAADLGPHTTDGLGTRLVRGWGWIGAALAPVWVGLAPQTLTSRLGQADLACLAIIAVVVLGWLLPSTGRTARCPRACDLPAVIAALAVLVSWSLRWWGPAAGIDAQVISAASGLGLFVLPLAAWVTRRQARAAEQAGA